MFRNCPDCDSLNYTFSSLVRKSRTCSYCGLRLYYRSQFPPLIAEFAGITAIFLLIDLSNPIAYWKFLIAIVVGGVISLVISLPFVGLSKLSPEE